MSNVRYLAKLKAYYHFWATQIRSGKHPSGMTRFRVLTVTLSQERKDNLRETAREVDGEGKAPNLFWFACERNYRDVPQQVMGPIWQTLQDDTMKEPITAWLSLFFTDPERLVLGTRKVPTSYTPEDVPWGISHADRRNHLYIIGKTGMGKTALLRNIILADIWRGAGVGVIDPHGDLAEDIIDAIPSERSDHVVYFDPSDLEYPIAWNPIQDIPPDARAQHADFLVDGFKSVFAESWGPGLSLFSTTQSEPAWTRNTRPSLASTRCSPMSTIAPALCTKLMTR